MFLADTDVVTSLQTAATAATTSVITATGAILVAAFAIPVAFKVYRTIKRALSAG